MDWTRILEDGLRSGVGLVAAVYALTAIGINLQFGYTGLTNYGQAGFLLVGAYGTAIAVDKWDWPLWAAFIVGVLAAILLGLLLGIPTLRLRADYLAIVTISAAEVLRIVVNSRAAQDVTGGPQGLKGFAGDFYDINPLSDGRYEPFGWLDDPLGLIVLAVGFIALLVGVLLLFDSASRRVKTVVVGVIVALALWQLGTLNVSYTSRDLWVILVTWGLVALTSVLMWLGTRSPWGRVLRAVREDEDAARSLGKNVYAFKMQSLIIGGVIGGIAGTMLVVDRQFVDQKPFESSITFLAYAALILGGVARILGPIIGAMTLWFFISASETFLREAVENEFLGIQNVIERRDVGPVRFILVGLLIMGLVIFRPQGFFGSRSEVMLGE